MGLCSGKIGFLYLLAVWALDSIKSTTAKTTKLALDTIFQIRLVPLMNSICSTSLIYISCIASVLSHILFFPFYWRRKFTYLATYTYIISSKLELFDIEYMEVWNFSYYNKINSISCSEFCILNIFGSYIMCNNVYGDFGGGQSERRMHSPPRIRSTLRT